MPNVLQRTGPKTSFIYTTRSRRSAAHWTRSVLNGIPIVKGGGKLGQQGGAKLDQRERWKNAGALEEQGLESSDGVRSGGLCRLKGGALRPERRTPSLATRVAGVVMSSVQSRVCACFV